AVPRPGEKAPEPERLTGGAEFTLGDFSWSPDGTRLAFGARRDPDNDLSVTSDIYVLDLADKSVKKPVDSDATGHRPRGSPRWSPDGTQIAFHTSDSPEFLYYGTTRIGVVPSKGGTPRVLTEAFDEQASLVAWGPDGIFFLARQKTADHLFRLDPHTQAIARV